MSEATAMETIGALGHSRSAQDQNASLFLAVIDNRPPHIEENLFLMPQSWTSYLLFREDGVRMRGCVVMGRSEYERLCAPPTFRAWLAGLWSRVRWPISDA